MWFHPTKFRERIYLLCSLTGLYLLVFYLYLASRYHAEIVKLIENTMILVDFTICLLLLICCYAGYCVMVALLCYCPSYNHLLLVLYQFLVCPLQCAWLLCYATVPLTTTFFWFSISSLCVHYNVHGCSAMLLSLLQPPSSGSLSVPCVSTTMCMVALLCYCPSYNHLLLVLFSSLCVHYNVHGCSAMLLSLLQPPSSGSLSVPCVSTTMCMVALLCYCPSYNHILLVLYQFPVCPLQCTWLLCYATVPLTTTFFWFSISSLCVCYNEVNDLTILINHHEFNIIRHYYALFELLLLVI